MSLQRAVIDLLDRPGGRSVLASVATRFARKSTGADIEIAYKDGLWMSRIGHYYVPDSEKFNYFANSFAKSASQIDEYFTNARDYWFYRYRPQPGDVIIDIGAGCGEDTLAFSEAVGEAGRVIAVEAHPGTFRLLQAFCRLNRIDNVTPVWLALMGDTGSVSMVESKSWEGHFVDRRNSESTIQVPAGTLDALCDRLNLKKIAFLKMNIEGAEREAIKGMTSSIEKVRTICVACHDFRADRGDGDHFRTRSVVESFLLEHGFQLTYRCDDPRQFVRDHVHGVKSK